MDRESTEISHKIYSENMYQMSATQFWGGYKPSQETQYWQKYHFPQVMITMSEKVQIVGSLHN
jgi:hypothetical protein